VRVGCTLIRDGDLVRMAVAIALALLTMTPAAGGRPSAQPAAQHTQLVIVVDGLRPDYVTREVMPRLLRLGQRGVVFRAHHSVFPTVTRVNASSFVTGAYPESHGILGNTIYIPAVDAAKGLDTGEKANLEAVARTEGTLLTAPTLSELLKPAGKTLLAVSSGSTGSVYLLNHTLATGGIIHYDFAAPPSLAVRSRTLLGPPPGKATPNDPLNNYAIDAYLKVGLTEVHPDVTFMWLNDPDGTAHNDGIGAEITLKSLALVDAGIGRVEDTLRARGILDRTNIIVTSDHGFSTHGGHLRLAALVEPFAKPMADGSKDLVIAEGAVYFRSGKDPARVAAIVAALQKRPEVGAVFTRPKSDSRGGMTPEGAVPGTLSYDVIRWNHPRAGDILVSANWNSERNNFGWPGKTTATGVAGHGTSSPFDIHNTLIAAGPDFREHAVSDVPTANVDITPTLLRLLGMRASPGMTGRVIEEALRDGPSIDSVRVEHALETVRTADGSYRLTAHISRAAGHSYLDYTEVARPAPLR
jgi:arylsulfatase A-like enzyme